MRASLRCVRSPLIVRAASTVAWGALAASAAAGFAVLGVHVEGRHVPGWDADVLGFVGRHRILPENDEPLAAAPYIGGVAVAVVLALLVRARRFAEAAAFAVTAAGAAVLSQSLKHAFVRPSPDGVAVSYPSGHALLSAAVAAAVALAAREARLRALAVVLGAAALAVVGIATVKLRWHYPSDVIGGWLVGLAWVAAVRFGARLAA